MAGGFASSLLDGCWGQVEATEGWTGCGAEIQSAGPRKAEWAGRARWKPSSVPGGRTSAEIHHTFLRRPKSALRGTGGARHDEEPPAGRGTGEPTWGTKLALVSPADPRPLLSLFHPSVRQESGGGQGYGQEVEPWRAECILHPGQPSGEEAECQS